MNDITKIATLLSEIVNTQLPEGCSLTDIERLIKATLRVVGQEVVKQIVEKQNATYPEPTSSCTCGGEARRLRKRKAKLRTIFGETNIKRDYYLCATCHEGHYPLDNQLGLRPNAMSAELSRLAGLTGVQLPFASAASLLEKLIGVSLSDHSTAKATQEIGKQVVVHETRQKEQATDEAYLLEQKRVGKRPRRLYGAMDATKVHIRHQDGNKPGWRDLKIISWFEARGQPPSSVDGDWRIEAEKISYHTDIAPAHQFGELLWSSGVSRHAQQAQELIFLADGAEWIWNLVNEHFPRATQILDWFHASEHLMPVAEAAFSDPEQRQAWITKHKKVMWEGDIETLVSACDTLHETCPHDSIRKAANYFETHKERMRYADFREQGYQIGSGTIESAAKQIGMMRLKVPGAIWNEENACLVAKARAAYLSDEWAELPLVV
jgi:hypothetical protein